MPKIKTVKRKNKNVQSGSEKEIFIKTLVFSFIIYAVSYIISCFAALMFDVKDSYDFYVSLICFALASFCSGYFAGIKLKKNGLVTGVLFTLPANTVLILISVILSDFSPDTALLISACVLLAGSAAGGIFAVNKRHRR